MHQPTYVVTLNLTCHSVSICDLKNDHNTQSQFNGIYSILKRYFKGMYTTTYIVMQFTIKRETVFTVESIYK
jgi:hypothetical protein